jgi:hypothetical protein
MRKGGDIRKWRVNDRKGSGGAEGLTFYIVDLIGSYPKLFPARNEVSSF